jgi:sulfonate transport system permease protein
MIAAPTAMFEALVQMFRDGSVVEPTLFTLSTAALGLLVAICLSVPLGIMLGLSRRAALMGYLSIETLRPIPSVALIPLAMLVFGFGAKMETSIVTLATFWPILILTQSAAQQVEPGLLELSRMLRLSPVARAAKIVLPAIVPRLFVALQLGVAVALVVAVTVEIAGNPNGMGYAMITAQQNLKPAVMLAWLLWIGVLGYLINRSALWLQRWVATRMGVQP